MKPQTCPAIVSVAIRAQDGQLELPVLPAVASEVLAFVDSEDADARALARLVQRDPSMAAHVLRVANSARYAPTEPIVSLTQAIGRLGLATLREIAVSVAVRVAVFKVAGHEALVEGLWAHAQATATVAREIARARGANVEAAFLSGLLHDIGAPIVLQGLVDVREQEGLTTTEAGVQEAIDTLHAYVGAELVRRWELAAWVAQSALHHHTPEEAEEAEDVVRTVALADALAHWLAGSDGEGVPPGLEHAEALELRAEDIEQVCVGVAPQLSSPED